MNNIRWVSLGTCRLAELKKQTHTLSLSFSQQPPPVPLNVILPYYYISTHNLSNWFDYKIDYNFALFSDMLLTKRLIKKKTPC